MSKYRLNSTDFEDLEDPPWSHHGTGTFDDLRKNLVEPMSVALDVVSPRTFANKKFSPLSFANKKFSITVMSFEIETAETPSWFGVSFRKGIRSFDSVNIFCHPSPGNAGMHDRDYASRANNWRRLFRYVEMLGSQIAVAGCDQILIVPFFSNAAYNSTGIFGPNWQDIVEQIRQAVIAKVRQASSPSEAFERTPGLFGKARAEFEAVISAPDPASLAAPLRNVVLSDFSYGRCLMWNVRKSAHGLNHFLREVWDFDGNGGAAPYSTKDVKGILYDQSRTADWRSYHVPAERWVAYHRTVVNWHAVHGDIPAMLCWHAASVSNVARPSR
jgi:hypothetical protein